MNKYRIYQVDSFTKSRFHGNPAGVVPNANGLSDEQMQRIAWELNNSETERVIQKTKAGILPVDVVKIENDYSIVMTQGKPEVSEDLGTAIRRKRFWSITPFFKKTVKLVLNSILFRVKL